MRLSQFQGVLEIILTINSPQSQGVLKIILTINSPQCQGVLKIILTPLNVRVSWKLSYVDWPVCLDYFEFDYYDKYYNESIWNTTVVPDFTQENMEFELLAEKIPCDDDYAYITRVSSYVS